MIDANYRVKAVGVELNGMTKYTMERVLPGKVELFIINCAVIQGLKVGDPLAVDIDVKCCIPISPVADISDVGNIPKARRRNGANDR